MKTNPSPGDSRREDGSDEALDLAARVADGAGEEDSKPSASSEGALSSRNETLDAGYHRALDEIAWLVEANRVAEQSSKPPSESWGPFELVERLGAGQSGEVFKARDRNLRHFVALKLFHPRLLSDRDRERLLIEGRRHALVRHANVAILHGADEYEGRVGIWMEYIEGATLQEIVERRGPFSAAEAVNFGLALCSAVGAVHSRGLAHGDIKAQNVMREKGGRVVLMDFSSSRSTLDSGSPEGPVGTPIYMAPELFEGQAPTVRSDVYALGVLLYYLVTARHPYEARSFTDLKRMVQRDNPRLLADLRPDLPAEFTETVHKAIESDPGLRFPTTGHLHAALRAASPAGPVDKKPGPDALDFLHSVRNLVRQAKIAAAVAAAAGFVAILGFLNELHLNLVLRVPDDFTEYSLLGAMLIGFRSLVPCMTLALMELAILGSAFALLQMFFGGVPGWVRKQIFGLRQWLDGVRADRIASAFALVSLAAVSGLVILFGDLLQVIVELVERPAGHAVDTRILGKAYVSYHIRFALAYGQVVILMTAGWFLIFSLISRRGEPGATVRFTKWVSGVSILVMIAIMATPWRLLTKKGERIEFDGQRSYVVAERGDEWFLYVPGDPDEQHVRVRREDSRLHRTERGKLESVW